MSRSITSTTAKVCENARTHSPPLHAASSPFATLLRRSRFASFDPLIRQTYFAPDSHANRGDYGTKRPLPVRRRNSFVTIASYDEHHNYTEWTRGESQVRFLRRFEELNVAAKPPEDRGWGTLLGRTLRDAWLVDSEFGHPQTEASSGLTPEPIIGLRLRPDASLPTTTPATLDFPKGRSGYGSRAKPEPVSIVSSNLVQPTAAPFAYDELPASKRFLVPNLEAMSTRRRRVYLRKLRSLRPQFAKFLEDKEQKQRVVDSQAKLDEEKRIIEANRQAQAELTSGDNINETNDPTCCSSAAKSRFR
ncbi:hypothetical protein DL96DRAFT_922999 [Flagelloscypha sp. PMI_526]|nr:hypothetical protein DL96DRAFT_922999 [Flagelloscypha sp. PMI_526]